MKSLILTILLFISIDGITAQVVMERNINSDTVRVLPPYTVETREVYDSLGNLIKEIYYIQDTASKHKRKSKKQKL